MQQVVEWVNKNYGRLDILINNAAIQVMGRLHEFTEPDFDRIIAVNLKGMFLSCRLALPIMMQQRKGVILATSSVLGLVADPDLAVYGATKAGMLALVKSIAIAYGTFGIRAVAVCPGDVDTPLVADYFNHQPNPEAARREVERHYPLGRIATPAEIARVFAFLASDDASFISGTEIIVDGGLLAQVY
jgi:NAD(P)-dependent dehydrogenase (short-subunit alcohol dehydrogenase family)